MVWRAEELIPISRLLRRVPPDTSPAVGALLPRYRATPRAASTLAALGSAELERLGRRDSRLGAKGECRLTRERPYFPTSLLRSWCAPSRRPIYPDGKSSWRGRPTLPEMSDGSSASRRPRARSPFYRGESAQDSEWVREARRHAWDWRTWGLRGSSAIPSRRVRGHRVLKIRRRRRSHLIGYSLGLLETTGSTSGVEEIVAATAGGRS